MALFIPNPLANVIAKVMAQPHVASVAEEGVRVAQQHVPVETGELRDSIHVEESDEFGKRIVVGTDHWLFPEFGTSEQAEQPFMRPIIDQLGLHR